MSLPRAGEESPPLAWLPSHVQVWVLQARGLRAKGGPGDAAFVGLQLGRQKHRTAVAAQKGGCPRWAEQCSLELPPPPPGPRPAPPPEPDPQLLQLVVWQRALVGPDRFLGRADLPLAALLQDGRSHPDRWYKLHSKPGKKEKDRGEIQLSLQFTRHSLTASMFDLSVKEKPRSPFRRLRDKMKGKHSYDLDSSSAIVPSSSGALDDNFRPGPPKDKARGSFFFKGQLRRSSLTRSSTSLGSASTLSSASSLGALGSTEGGAPSLSRHSSFSTDPAGRDFLPSPQLTHKRAFSDEVSQINLLPEAVQGLKTPKDPSSGSSLCINGSHIYCEEPTPKPSFLMLAPFPPAQSEPGKQERGSGAGLPAAQPDLLPWPASDSQKGPPKDLPRFIPSPPILAAQEEDKLSVKTIALNKQRVRARQEEGLQTESKPIPMAAPLAFPLEVRRVRPQDERDHRGSLRGHSQSPEPHLEAPSGEKEEPQSDQGGGRISLRDPRESARKPSSQPCLPATPELAKDPWVVSEDQGLPPSIQAGEAQPSPLAPPARHLQSPSPTAAAAAPTRPPVEGDDGFAAFAASRLQPAALEPEPPLAMDPPPGGSAGLLPQQEEGPPSPERASQESPDWLSFAFGKRDRAWSGSGGILLVRGTFGEGANSAPNASSLREEEQALGEATFAQNLGQLGSSVPLAPDVPEEALSWTLESCPRNRTIPSSEQLDWDREQQTLPQSQLAPQAESSEPSWLPWDPQREEDVGFGETVPTSGGPAQEEQGGPAETEGPRGAGTPPPKPSRRVLRLTKEASGAGRGTPESAQPGGADPEPPQHLLPVWVAGSPPAAAVSLVPAVIIGAGPPEGLPLAAAEDKALLDDQPGSQEGSSGATILTAEEGPSTEALPFSTCPSQLSLGRLGLSGVPESPRQDGDTGFAPWGLEGAWPTGLPGSASLWSSERFPRPPEASQGPSKPQGAPSPSLLFWSALEEPRGLPGGGTSLESPCGLGQNEGATGLAPLPQGQEPEAPSGQAMDFRKASFWQEGRREPESKQEDPPLTPGNPFAPWAAPSPQKNPFVERPPAAEVPGAQTAILPVSFTVDAHSLGEFPAATDPPRQLCSHSFSVEPPVGPSRPGPPRPLAFSTPSFQPIPSPTDCHLPSPLGPISAGAAVDGQTGPPLSPLLSPPSMDASAPSVLPMEMLPAQDAPRQQAPSPHPVKPMRSTPAPDSPRKETARLASSPSRGQITGQEQLAPMPAISGTFAASVVPLEKMEPKQSPSTKYHHLTREELLQLLFRREAELGKKEEQVRELEGYIDRLLVRIMEQSPTLLQIPLEDGGLKATQ